MVFGISVPGGNFIPGMTMGAMVGRIMGEVMLDAGLIEPTDVGMYALVGAAAVLNGITRMTLTIAVVLIELTKDVGALLPIVVSVTTSKLVGGLVYESFDDAMMKWRKFNYLPEAPPRELEHMLTASVMSSPPVCIHEVEKVSTILTLLATTQHNGFPVLSSSSEAKRIDEGGRIEAASFNGGRIEAASSPNHASAASKRFAGLILRRQLLVVLEARVWEQQRTGTDLPLGSKRRFVGSFFSRLSVVNISLSTKDLRSTVDLRPFVDPSPYVASELMPMRRVYRLFNEIGVRHLPVVTDQRCVGIGTSQVAHSGTRGESQPEISRCGGVCQPSACRSPTHAPIQFAAPPKPT